MKKILAMLLACVMVFSSTIVCFATDNTNELKETTTTMVVSEGTPLPITVDGEFLTCLSNLYEISGTTTGYISGSFSVPASESGKLIKVAWASRALSSSGASGTFKLKVSGNGHNHEIYLPCGGAATGYSIANLPEGKYSFSLSPHEHVSGDYTYVLQFYSFG